MANPIQARTEFASALNAVCNERGLDPQVVLDSIKAAIVAALRKDHPEEFEDLDEIDDLMIAFDVDIDPETGNTKVYKLENNDRRDVTPPGFGRIAAQTAKQVILQRVREAEKAAIIDEYREKVNTMITGMVLRFDGKNVIFDIGRGQGYMPPEDQIRSEFYKMNARHAVYIKDIRNTMRGETIIVSRSVPELVIELFKREVPEVNSGAVVIKSIAREAGVRTKIAVDSTQSGVDPVGSCVGQKGVRVQEVINELNNEKIDIIQYTSDVPQYISSALAPAENLSIEVDESNKVATIAVPEDQMSLAIGRGGQNVRLAAKLTGYKINITSASGKSLSVTGDEEYEIDQLGLPQTIRDNLVEAGVTNMTELDRQLEVLRKDDRFTQDMISTIEQMYQHFQDLSSHKRDDDSSNDEDNHSEDNPDQSVDQDPPVAKEA